MQHRYRPMIALSLLLPLCCVLGCGGDGLTVIEPGNYQLTEQERANQVKVESMRGEQDVAEPTQRPVAARRPRQ